MRLLEATDHYGALPNRQLLLLFHSRQILTPSAQT